MADWKTKTVECCLTKLKLSSLKKLQTKDYRPSGRFPIIDQGRSSIAGWTDDESGLIDQNLPVIVFGDHTRSLKYVDFPFIRGADGTQILKPTADLDPLYFFYALRGLDLPSRGYNRHFKALKENEIGIPDPTEQAAIARILRLVDTALETQGQEIASWQRCKRAAMRELFSKGLRGAAQKETRIGPLPARWDADRLDRHATIVLTRMTYSELEGLTPTDDDQTVRVLGIKVADMNRPGNEIGLATAALEKNVPLAIAAHRCAPPGTIIFPNSGAAIATNKKRITREWTAFDSSVISGVISDETLDQDFLFHWFQMFDLGTIAESDPIPHLNKKNLEPLAIPVPPTVDEQREIAAILNAIDRKIDLHRQKRAVLGALFKALLHKLMCGEIRVADLDLSALDARAIAGIAA